MLIPINRSLKIGFPLVMGLVVTISAAFAQTGLEKLEITVATPGHFPPHYSVEPSGLPGGFAIDVMNEIAKLANLDVTYRVEKNWPTSHDALRNGTVHVIPNMGITERRKKDFAFSSPVETFAVSYFVSSDSTRFREPQDLIGHKIGVVKVNVGYALLKDRKDVELVTYSDLPPALFGLLAGQVDAIAYPEPVTWKFARDAKVSDRLKVLSPPLIEIKRGLAVRKDNTELLARLDRAVVTFVESPEYMKIYHRWWGEPVPFWTVTRVAIAMGLALFLSIATVMVWRHFSLLRVNRRLEAAIGELRDTSAALQKSEENFRNLAEHIREVFWVGSPDWREVKYVSPAYEEIWGRPRQSLYDDPMSWAQSVHADDQPAMMKVIMERVENDTTVAIFPEYRIIRPDGSQRWIFARGFPVQDEDGNVVQIVGIAEDITERKLAEDNSRDLHAELAHVSRLSNLGEMAAGFAHELNQPLTAISNYAAGSIRRQQLGTFGPDDTAAAFELVAEQANRAGEIIRRIRKFVSKEGTETGPININASIIDAAALMRPDAEKNDVAFKLDLPEGLPKVAADTVEIQQVVINLARNGIEAIAVAESELRELAIRTEVLDATDVKVTVTDTGSGIPDHVSKRLFEPFFTTKEGGMGIGLLICQRIVQGHGGNLTIAPNGTNGTSISFTLPIAQAGE
ncbi:MAG: transporter substrate-binding domain-containing protein [Rhodospirillales bacterium]|nr:transporter substrate-binding domain-containing protein [Rhodospirillales bacterium]